MLLRVVSSDLWLEMSLETSLLREEAILLVLHLSIHLLLLLLLNTLQALTRRRLVARLHRLLVARPLCTERRWRSKRRSLLVWETWRGR